jgi:hypothetical protein
MMRTTLKWLGGGLLGLVLVVGGLLLVSRFWPSTTLQQEALAALETGPQRPGSNAYVALMTLHHESLDAAARRALVDALASDYGRWQQRFEAHWLENGGGMPPAPAPQLGGEPVAWVHDDALCRINEGGACLDKVRAAPQAVADALAARAGLLERIAALSTHGHLRSELPLGPYVPLPPLQSLGLPLAAHALAHVQGDRAGALAGVCRDAGTARMLVTRSDTLVSTMIGARLLQAHARLLAAMLEEMPLDVALPAQCAAAFAPLSAAEMSGCNALRGEFEMADSLLALEARRIGRYPGGSWVFNAPRTRALQAVNLGQSCLPAAQTRIAQDLLYQASQAQASVWRLECATNAIGCILGSVAAPAYEQYPRQLQDVGAELRLLNALLWLRGQPLQGSLATRLQAMPSGYASAQRPVLLAADGRGLETVLYAPRGGENRVRLPLPAALWEPAP